MLVRLYKVEYRGGSSSILVAIDQILSIQSIFSYLEPHCRVTLKSGEVFDVSGSLDSIEGKINEELEKWKK